MTLDELKKEIETRQAKSAVAPEMKAFVTLVLTAIKTAKDNFQEISAENLQTIKDAVAYIDQIKSETEQSIDVKGTEFKTKLDGKISELEGLIKEVKALPQREKVIEKTEVIREVPIVTNEIKEVAVTDTGEEIIDKVNSASNKINIEKINGLNELEQRIKGDIALPVTTMLVNGKRAKNLSITGGTVNVVGDTANITVTGGSGGGTWGSITGTLSDQTDLQTALDAKLDGNGTATYVPFYSDANTLSSDSHFFYNSTTDVLHVHGLAGDATDGLLIESDNGTDIAIMGAANTANVTWYGNHNFNTVTASRVAQFGASKTLESSTVTNTELGYLSGVTSAIQTQIDGKANSAGALTQFVGNTAWRVFYSDASGDIQELALGADGTFLKSNGASVAPSFATPAGSGDVSKVGTPVDNELAVWTGDGTVKGVDITYDDTSFNIPTGKNFQIAGGTVLSDSAGTLTLSSIDAIDATTEATIESAIDTLANLTSIQGRTVTLADAGADAIFGWDDSASAYQNLSAADALLALGVTSTASELNILDGATLTTTELNYVDGVTSAIQTQLDAKLSSATAAATYQPLDADLTDLSTKWTIASASGAASLQFHEDTDNGTNKITLTAPASVASDKTITFPDATGTVALTSDIPSLTGYVNTTGTPANNQIAIFVDADTVEGDSSVTFDGTSFNIATGKNFQIAGATILADSAGTTTLSNIDALDATTEATIEAAIDTLANLTSIQGRTVTLADAGANAIFGWDDTAGAYENLTQAEARTVLGLGTAAYVATDLADLNEATIEGAIDTLANLTSIQGRTVTLADAGADAIFGWDDSASAYQNLSAADVKTALSLNNVENTALSTWAGSTNITTLGTISTGSWNATDIPLSAGGTGASLADPNADRIMFWDDSAGSVAWLTVGTGLSITDTTISASGGSGENITKSITQTTHGFAVGDVLKYSGSTYAKAQADSSANAEVVGIVSAVADANTFTLLTAGYISGLSGLTANTTYFLSPSSAGALTATEPSTVGQISKPLLRAVSTTAGYFVNMRGVTVSASAGTPSVTVMTPDPTQGVDGGLIGITYNSNTTGYTISYDIPFEITVNSIDIRASGAAATPGTVDIGIYSEDGQTKHIDVTSGTIDPSQVYHIAVSAVTLSPGRYYVVLVPNSTANVELNAWDVVGVNFGDTGEPVLVGTQTVTASTLPSTFNPSSAITFSNSSYGPFIRLNA